MFQRLTTALFGADLGELRPEEHQHHQEEEEEDWILVNYLTDSATASNPDDHCDVDSDSDLVLIPSVPPSPHRRPSLTSLSSTATDDLDATATDSTATEEDDDDEGPDDDGFLRLNALEESWILTPPACFTRSQPLPLEPSPLENLLIEHPSMSVYLLPVHNMRPPHNMKPHRAHHQRAPASGGKQGAGGKKEKRRGVEARHRPEGIQRRPSGHSSVLSAALSARVDLLQPARHSVTPPSRNALRRLNPQRPPKTTALQLHQPSHRQFNF